MNNIKKMNKKKIDSDGVVHYPNISVLKISMRNIL